MPWRIPTGLKRGRVASGDLAWVPVFIDHVRPYIFVRTTDNVLIKRPNQVVKLNPSGARILKYLLDGGSIVRLTKRCRSDSSRMADLEAFLLAVKAYLEGRIDPLFPPRAVEMIPLELNLTRLPVLSEIALNYECNLKCRFCYAGDAQPAHDVMEPAEVRCVLDILYRDAQVPSVSFTGGEPTLDPELCEYIRYAKKLGMRVNLITNGTRIDRAYARSLACAGLDSAQVSLEGANAATHDAIVGAQAFDRAVTAVLLLNAAGIRTHTNTTVNRMNLQDLPAFPAFVKNTLRVPRFSMNLMIPVGSGAANTSLVVGYAEIGLHLENLLAESRRQDVDLMWYSPVPMCLFNSVLHGLGNKGCSACDGLVSIAPDGGVRPCAAYPESVGNILREGFEAAWASRRARIFRRKELAPTGCASCEDFNICNGACPLYFQQQGCDELTAAYPRELA